MNKYCSNCGKEIVGDSKFCQNCGVAQENKTTNQANNESVKPKKKNLPVWAIVLIIFIAVVALLSIFREGSSELKPKYDSNGNPVYIKESDYERIFVDPNDYKGEFIDLSGKIFTDPEKGDDYTAFQMYTDVENYDKDIVVYYDGDIQLKSDDFVKITGYIGGTLEGENAFGGTVTAPIVVVTKLEKTDYKNVVSPTIKEIAYNNKTINQHGCIISITKVEFAEKETRIYVTARNKSKYDFEIYTYSSTIVQGTKQYDQQSNYDTQYQELQDELKPGVVSNGIITFPAIGQQTFKLTMKGSSDNWDIDISDYVFTLEVK